VIQPSREAFRALARDHTVVPVWRDLLADFVTPVSAFARIVGDGAGFLLESVDRGERWSRYSFVGRHPLTTIVARGTALEVRGAVPDGLPTDRGVLGALEWLVAAYRTPPLPELPPLHAGVMGYLGYDVVREVERLPNAPADDRGLPDAMLSVIGELAAFDHWRQQVTLLACAVVAPGADETSVDAAYDDAVRRLDQLAADGARPLDEPLLDPPSTDEPLPEYRSVLGSETYGKAVEVAKEHIAAGDIFQVVLSQRFDVDLAADPFDVYRVLRQINPSPYMYFVRYPELTVVGASPEPMVQLRDGRVVSRPIAGTRPRGATDEEDRLLGAELREHPKEVAEHVMLLDLARNDVGRVVAFGTEQVDETMTLEHYSHVMHLTSQVSGALA
jgi:anthranilate synthase component 1